MAFQVITIRKNRSMITVTSLSIYPVKSLGGIRLQSTFVDSFGLQQDRRWMVVDADKRFLTQRQQARMCLISTRRTESGIELSANGMASIDVVAANATSTNGNLTTVQIWQDSCDAADCGDKAAQWLSKFLHIDCRLVYFPDDGVRPVDVDYARPDDRTAFSDGFPILLTSEASLADLNERIEVPLEMQRFRPNIVVGGCEAYAEDNWRTLKIGEITFRVVKPCSRCGIPNINPLTADKEQEPSKALISYRRRDGKIFFGQNLIANEQGNITTGLSVEILEAK